MENEELIAVELFCTHHQVEFSFINELSHSGLVQVTNIEEKNFLPATELQKLEQLVRMHYELEINLEGLEAISHLLDRLRLLQTEMTSLRNQLKRYETPSGS